MRLKHALEGVPSSKSLATAIMKAQVEQVAQVIKSARFSESEVRKAQEEMAQEELATSLKQVAAAQVSVDELTAQVAKTDQDLDELDNRVKAFNQEVADGMRATKEREAATRLQEAVRQEVADGMTATKEREAATRLQEAVRALQKVKIQKAEETARLAQAQTVVATTARRLAAAKKAAAAAAALLAAGAPAVQFGKGGVKDELGQNNAQKPRGWRDIAKNVLGLPHDLRPEHRPSAPAQDPMGWGDAAKLIVGGPPILHPAHLPLVPPTPNTLALTPLAEDVDAVVLRGLVGQRGPTEPASVAHCAQDALLPYALPPAKALARAAATVRHVLDRSPAPTADEVARAARTCRALLAAPARADDDGEAEPKKRPRLVAPTAALDGESLVAEAEALAALEGNFAITGVEPARADDARRGIELPHEVRWMPQGPRAATMARVALLEHAVARCEQVAGQTDTPAPVARALRGAAAALKLQQLEPLYALKEAAAYEDSPHPLGTATPLVTRPCAVVRGVLSFPTDAGVAPRPAQVGTGLASTDTATLEQAVGATAAATAALRNQLRRERVTSHFYVAPPASALAFREAPTGASVEGDDGDDVNEGLGSAFYSVDELSGVTNRALVLVAQLCAGGELDGVSAFLDAEALESGSGGAGAVTAQTRRGGIWTEFQRHLAISQDRLWIFVRLMSGCIGGDVSEVITMADEATLAATRIVQQQRADISKRVSDMQAKIVETVVGSMLKSSGLTLSYAKDDLTVVDAEAKKQLQDLAAGTSGRPFFEANVAMRNLAASDTAPQTTLSEVLRSLGTAGAQMQATLEKGLVEPGMGVATLTELSHPTNSYFVAMRPDATAAIREAHEKLNVELAMRGGGRRLALWELVEGGCTVLTNRFADFCGFLLVQKRSSTGVSAMYVSHTSIHTNASQARVSLARLAAAAAVYASRVPAPSFDGSAEGGGDAQNGEPPVARARWAALTAAEAVQDSDVVTRPLALVRSALWAPVHVSGWRVV